jgi:hypothetical protein
MGLGLIFWILMLLWLVFGIWSNWAAGTPSIKAFGGDLLAFILFLVIGWKIFGAPVQ